MHIDRGIVKVIGKRMQKSSLIVLFLFFFLCYSFSMSNSTCPKPNLSVKHVVTLFEEVQNRYINKLISIDEKHISIDERHKVNKHFFS